MVSLRDAGVFFVGGVAFHLLTIGLIGSRAAELVEKQGIDIIDQGDEIQFRLAISQDAYNDINNTGEGPAWQFGDGMTATGYQVTRPKPSPGSHEVGVFIPIGDDDMLVIQREYEVAADTNNQTVYR